MAEGGARDAGGLGTFAPTARVSVEGVEQPTQLEVRQRADVRQRSGELRDPVAKAGEPADQPRRRRPATRSGRGVRVPPTSCGDGTLRARTTSSTSSQRWSSTPIRVEPREDVLPAIAPGHTDVLAGGERDLATGTLQLLGDLNAAGRGADDEHATVRQLVRVAIPQGRDGGDARREAPGDRRDHTARGARRQHDRPGLPAAPVGLDVEALSARPHRAHRCAGQDGSSRGGRVSGDVVGDIGGRQEPVRVVAGVGPAGKAGHPVGGEQSQRVPALRFARRLATSPRSRTTWSIERAVRWRLIASPECPAPTTTAVTIRHQTTVTVTSVGLVTMSYTAERFCDCATTARISSAVASASIV